MFFVSKDKNPEGFGFATFGATHLIWLTVIALFSAFMIVIYRKSDTNKRKNIRLVLGITILLTEIIKDIVSGFVGSLSLDDLPLHLCGINILIIGFDLIKQNATVRNFLYYFCIPGALLALFFPNWTMLPCMNFFHIHSFIVHALLVLYPLLLVTSGEVKPEIKMMPKSILLLIGMAIPIYFVNMLCDTNFMFLMDPETGNPLGLFERYLGSHLWGFPILLPVVMFIMYIPILISSKCKRKNVIHKEEKSEATV